MLETIDTIEISNFQSHKHSVIELHPGLNVLKGTSHHGKSSIIRGLKWLFFNDSPGRGDGFKSHFAGEKDPVDIAVSFTEGDWVARAKDSENKYYSDSFNLKAVRTDVPDEVKKLTRIGEINFQGQDKPYFLIQDTPGVAGKKLNEVVGLQIIDEVRTKANQKVSTLDSSLKITIKNIEETEKNLENYKHVKQAERLVNRIDFLQNNQNSLFERRGRISSVVSLIKNNQKVIQDLKSWLEIEKDFVNLKEQINSLKQYKSRQLKISSLVKQITIHSKTIEEGKIIVSLAPDFKNLKNNLTKLKELKLRREKINGIYLSLKGHERQIKNLSSAIKTDLVHKKELEKQLNFCQTCGAAKKYWGKKT